MSFAHRPHKLERDIAAERRALDALAIAAQQLAPAALRARLELARDPRPHWRASRPLAVVGATAALATGGLATLVALLIGGGGPGAPTVAAAAALGSRAQTVALRSTTGVSAAGIPFPDWSARFGLRALGVRHDRLDGRLATTVFYGSGGQRIAYTIVSGASLPAGAGSHPSVWDGTRLETLSAGGRATVSWVQGGHSCVLSATGTPASTLARLASSETASTTYG